MEEEKEKSESTTSGPEEIQAPKEVKNKTKNKKSKGKKSKGKKSKDKQKNKEKGKKITGQSCFCNL